MKETVEILEQQIHIMKTSGIQCFCDRCEVIKEVINLLRRIQ